MHQDEQEKSEKELLQDIRFDIWIIKILAFGYLILRLYNYLKHINL